MIRVKQNGYLILLLVWGWSAAAQESFGVQFIDNWNDTTITMGPGNVRYSDCYGFNINAQNYAVIGSTIGAHFLKITPTSIDYLVTKEGSFEGKTVQHRDYKKYKNYIYAVCDEGASSLQIFDVSFLPDSVHKVYDSNEFFEICHNIFIDTISAKLYACGPNNEGMKILDLTNPVAPKLALNFNNLPYVHDCFVRNDTAFLNAGSSGLVIYDFNQSSPVEIGLLNFYVDQGYNHSGWWSEDGLTYCFIDETLGKKIKYCRIDNGIQNINVNALFGTKNAINYIPHNIQLFMDFAFVSYYNEGLRIFDLKAKPIKEVAFYDTYLSESDFKLHGAWGVYLFKKDNIILISDRQGGLFSFYFPAPALRNIINDAAVFNIPFIDANSLIIIQPKDASKLKFSIYSINGALVYEKQSYLNWVNIPLFLNPGTYIYHVTSIDLKTSFSGMFVAN
ncbi:hypothetical protein DNU06_03750 [Putridiphycobacter roseus]|uniref:Secretion system C-terminal sorting domain-containing protein n=1 Tax=Putridiphycobacter roseus TaxID=2219161 RepID=A0A2W1NIS9_9FLAO|nr:choice-of-anchor B family protein [Putridiphycobacter roseus]PZE18953.1 hypothetical protein DNU06_03750 [Putridiphycobacter roseus]